MENKYEIPLWMVDRIQKPGGMVIFDFAVIPVALTAFVITKIAETIESKLKGATRK